MNHIKRTCQKAGPFYYGIGNYISKGERCDRRRWREEGAERVAGVDEGRRRSRQGHSSGTATGTYNNAKGVVHLEMESEDITKRTRQKAGPFYYGIGNYISKGSIPSTG